MMTQLSLDKKSIIYQPKSRNGHPIHEGIPNPLEILLKKGGIAFSLKIGEIAEGALLEKRGNRIYIDLGLYGTGIIFGKEFYAANYIIKNLTAGDRVTAKVVDLDNEEGYVELSLKEAGDERRWLVLKKAKEEGTALELPVLEANRGGLLLEAEGQRGFLPASHLSIKHYPRVEGGDKEKIYQELKKFVGETLKVKIFDIEPKEQKLIFTEKGVYSEELQELFSKYHVGDMVEGIITGVVDFGAFMKFGAENLEGLIHISEIGWTLIENPRDFLKPGEVRKAKIIDMQDGKISLSLKALREDPWLKIHEKYQKGDVLEGTITKLNPFGAFVQIDDDFHGLAHISEFGTEANMRQLLAIGQTARFHILLIDPKDHRLLLGFGEKQKDKLETVSKT